MSAMSPRDLRCPAGCAGFLVREFSGESIQVRCRGCGYYVRYEREDPLQKADLLLRSGFIPLKLTPGP